jgi:hypothetical protein
MPFLSAAFARLSCQKTRNFGSSKTQKRNREPNIRELVVMGNKRPFLASQKTSRTDEWVATIAPLFGPVGSRSDFARFVEGQNATHGKIVRWTNTISRWLKRERLPSLEQYFLVEAWHANRKEKGEPEDYFHSSANMRR